MSKQPKRKKATPPVTRPAKRGNPELPEGQRRPLIVGIGASAGGLEAVTALLRHLPTDSGMAFVLVQHLDPVRESALTELLSRATSMPVREVTNDLPVEPNQVYVIPPGNSLTIVERVLRLQPRPPPGARVRSIDAFLESLAQDQRERAIGVILSGTASDGTLGLEAVKAEGGITFAQDGSARYDSMPRSAIAAGCVDFVHDPEGIAKELERISKHPLALAEYASPEDDRASATEHENDETPLPSGGSGTPRTGAGNSRVEAETARDGSVDNGYRKVLLLLRNHCGVDFSLYKSATIRRRIGRRMILSKCDTLAAYAQFLRGNTTELDALYSDTLISVTSFFRNPEAFDVLKDDVFPRLFQQSGRDPLRVWVLGCSTGQEAYSIAMSFMEVADDTSRMQKLQIFATDLNDALLQKARHGLYAKTLAQDISPERLRRFFVEEEGGYRVGKHLREMVVFARQNLISDPPFSRMDLVSCRNLMIYLQPSLQEKLLPTFHYALKPGGFLFLGASESIGSFTDLFEPVDRRHKIFARKVAPTPAFHLPLRRERGDRATPLQPSHAMPRRGRERGQGAREEFRGELSSQREADRLTVNKYAPPAVLVNAELQVVQFRGPTSAFLEPPTGKASFDVLKMARQGLMLPLRAAINQAKKENKTARKENVRINQNGEVLTVNVEVVPLRNLRERSFLVVFEDAARAGRAASIKSSPGRPAGDAKSRRVTRKTSNEGRGSAELERELSDMSDFVQSLQEQHEATNEELQASNEEIQSANEELQSINEELETSKEELESANEELTTVNEEMTNRNAELNRLNSDLVNLQASANLAILLLGRDLTIRRFSAQAERQFNLLATDIGRPIGGIRHNLDLADLDDIISHVIVGIRENEREVQGRDGRWYSLRVRPYLTLDNKVDGAVLVLVDIDELKRTELAVSDARQQNDAIIRTVPDPLVILHGDLRVQGANDAFYETFKVSPEETEGQLIYDLGNRQWDIPRLRELLEDILPRNTFFTEFEVAHAFRGLGQRTMLLNARMLIQSGDKARRILLGIRDVTDIKRAERRQRMLADELAHRGKNLLAVVHAVVTNSLSAAQSLDDANEAIGLRIQALSRSQSMLTERDFEGASLAEIIRLELEAFPARVEVSGPDLAIDPGLTQTFFLLIHELATNATKHGALSRPEGRIAINWSVEGAGADARFRFRWQEAGGPPVAPPVRRGFGRTLIERAVAHELDTQPTLEFAPEGFRYSFDAQLSAVVAGAASPAKRR